MTDQAAGVLGTRLASFIEQNRLPGGAAGVVCGDELVWSAGAGFADLAAGTAADPVMLYGIASELAGHRPSPSTRPAPVPENFRALLGIYARPGLGGWLIRLEWTDGKLVFTTAEAPESRIVLRPTPDPDLFTIIDGGGLSGGTVTFRRLSDGRVASVLLMDSTWVRLNRVAA